MQKACLDQTLERQHSQCTPTGAGAMMYPHLSQESMSGRTCRQRMPMYEDIRPFTRNVHNATCVRIRVPAPTGLELPRRKRVEFHPSNPLSPKLCVRAMIISQSLDAGGCWHVSVGLGDQAQQLHIRHRNIADKVCDQGNFKKVFMFAYYYSCEEL
jgi:hypothetical protein